ncbi:MAG: hypothetical protein U0Q18_10295 [Bryobacteraceae bacterium]
MKVRSNYLAALAVAVLLLACIAAWQLTRDSSIRATKKAAVQISKVDDRLLLTARQLAALADTAPEQDLAIQAMHYADQELDQDFATAIREAAASAPPSSGPLHDLAVHLAQAKARVDADQQRIAQLTKESATKSAAADKLEMAKAQMALDQDELDDAQQDLARQGGDERANLQRALQEHQAVQQKTPALAKISSTEPPETLWRQLQLWFALNSRQDQVEAAHDAAERKTSVLSQTHKALESNLLPLQRLLATKMTRKKMLPTSSPGCVACPIRERRWPNSTSGSNPPSSSRPFTRAGVPFWVPAAVMCCIFCSVRSPRFSPSYSARFWPESAHASCSLAKPIAAGCTSCVSSAASRSRLWHWCSCSL